MGRALVPLAILAVVLAACDSLLPRPPEIEVQYPVGPYVAVGNGTPLAVPAEAAAGARQTALDHVRAQVGPVEDVTIVDEALVAGFKRLVKADGSGTSGASGEADVWVFVVRAPPQGGWARIEGFVLVGTDGRVTGSGIMQSNAAP